MPAKNPWQHEVVHLNNKGLDLIHPIEQVDAEHYSRMEDVKSLQEGTITPRPGTSLINSTAFATTGFAAGTASETGSGCGVSAFSVISDSSGGSYGSYVTLIASTSRQSKFWTISIVYPAGSNTRQIAGLDISFDSGSGPEVNFIEGHTLWVDRNSGTPRSTGTTFSFPFEVPSGSRIRAKIFDDSSSALTYSVTASMIG